MENDNDNFEMRLCPNCGEFVNKRLKNCSNCKSSLVSEVYEGEEPGKETLSLERSLFVCSNCGAFIGIDATHCNACGVRRAPVTAKIDVSHDNETSNENENSIMDKLLESPTDLFLCESCGAFLGPKAEKCEICGAKVDETEVLDSEIEAEDSDEIQETIASDILSSEGSLSLCSNCGAFIKPESINCGICGAATEEIMEIEEEEIEAKKTESKLSSPGMLYMCENCGAFCTHKSEICTTCGKETQKDTEYKVEVEPEADVPTPPIITSVTDKIPKKMQEISSKRSIEKVQRDTEYKAEGESEADVSTPPIITSLKDKAPKRIKEIGSKRSIEKEISKTPIRTKAIVVDDCKRLWYKKAVALKKLGRYNRALKSLNRALSLSPDDKRLLLEKADILYELKRYQSASKHYRLLLELEPDNIIIWNKLGNALFRLGHQNESRSCYEKALSLDANNREAIINKGYLFIKLERYDEAVECALKVVA